MAKKTLTPKDAKPPVKIQKNAVAQPGSKDFLDAMDSFFDKHLSWLIWVFMGITLLVSLLLFDPRISLSGDDSAYIIRAYDFIHSFTYPTYQGPMYPMVLSLFVSIFGISLVPLKVFSLISMLGFVYLFFIAFRSRIPSTLMAIVLMAVSINSFILYYASQTYSEAFYMFVQMLLVFVFFKWFIDIREAVNLKQDIKRHLLLALCLLAITLTRSVGFSAVFAVIGYFILRGQWKNLLYSVAAFGMLFIVFQGVKYILWGESGLQFSSQGSGLLNKDYYTPQAGKEDLVGLLKRFLDNSNQYLSKHFLFIFGFRAISATSTVNPFLTVLLYAVALAALAFSYFRNKYLFFTGLLAGSFILVTFIALQAKWDQSRLIVPSAPFLLLILASFFYYLSKIKNLKILQVAIPIMALIVFVQSLSSVAAAIKNNKEISGRFGGLTPDWKNYLKASEWAAANLPADAVIACRKPSISFVYGNGRNFFGIMQLPNYNSENFLKEWQKDESSHILFNYSAFAGRQMDPSLINTIKANMMAIILLGDSAYLVDKVSDTTRIRLAGTLKTAGIPFTSSAGQFKAKISQSKREVKIYYPDSLVDQLLAGRVTHIITANLRRNPTVKDGKIINTVERYVAYISEKYPQLFTKVSQMGNDDNEPSTIVKVEYEKIGRKLKNADKTK